MYGMIARIRAVAGKRGALVTAIQAEGDMPGCLSYVIAADKTDPDLLWITEVWQDKESHKASLTLETVKAAIARARPLMAGFEAVAETEPMGGVGL